MIGNIIKQLRTEKEVTQKDLANYLGLTPKMISFYEKEERIPPNDILLKLSDYFDVSTDYLTGKSKYKNFKEEFDYKLNTNQLSKELSIYDSINVNKSNITNIPIVGTVRAGEPILAQENITGYSPVLNKFISRDKNYFYLRVQGDSMNQEFNEGDLLLIEQTDYIENGDIAVVLIDGQEATVKKVIKNENMVTLIPMSTNPKYVPKMYDVVKDEIKIIGKVIQATKIY